MQKTSNKYGLLFKCSSSNCAHYINSLLNYFYFLGLFLLCTANSSLINLSRKIKIYSLVSDIDTLIYTIFYPNNILSSLNYFS